MAKIFLIVGLALLPLIPQALAVANFLVNGGLQWPMTWNNEAAVWGILFFPAAVYSIYRAVKLKLKLLVLLPVLTIVLVWSAFFMHGYTQSSKSDSPNLELIAFWTDQWGLW